MGDTSPIAALLGDTSPIAVLLGGIANKQAHKGYPVQKGMGGERSEPIRDTLYKKHSVERRGYGGTFRFPQVWGNL